jgi:hypothetical protein
MTYELERNLKEVVMACPRLVPQNLPGGQRNNQNLSQDMQFPNWDSNQFLTEYDS